MLILILSGCLTKQQLLLVWLCMVCFVRLKVNLFLSQENGTFPSRVFCMICLYCDGCSYVTHQAEAQRGGFGCKRELYFCHGGIHQYYALISQNIMTTCLICCWSSLCRHSSTNPLRHCLYKTPEGVLWYQNKTVFLNPVLSLLQGLVPSLTCPQWPLLTGDIKGTLTGVWLSPFLLRPTS